MPAFQIAVSLLVLTPPSIVCRASVVADWVLTVEIDIGPIERVSRGESVVEGLRRQALLRQRDVPLQCPGHGLVGRQLDLRPGRGCGLRRRGRLRLLSDPDLCFLDQALDMVGFVGGRLCWAPAGAATAKVMIAAAAMPSRRIAVLLHELPPINVWSARLVGRPPMLIRQRCLSPRPWFCRFRSSSMRARISSTFTRCSGLSSRCMR